MMQKFALTCDMGHEEVFKKEVEAESLEAATEMLVSDPDVMAHLQQAHPDMAGKSPEELKMMTMGMVKPMAEEGMGQAM